MIIKLNSTQLEVRKDSEGRLSLTDLWRGAGSIDKKSPNDWQIRDSTTELIDTLCDILNTPKMGVLKTKRGRYMGGTWAHKNLALSYAKWLNPQLHIAVNQAFFERLEEEANPELAVKRGNERAAKVYQKQGHSDNWIAQRIVSITTRKAFTFTLASKGVHKDGFRNCTNAIYGPLYGGTSTVVRHKKGLAKGQSIRDNMSLVELSAIMLSESLAMEQIESANIYGNAQCELVCTKASQAVAKSILVARQKI